MSFDIKTIAVLTIGGIEIWITETMTGTWIIMALLIALAVAVRVRLNKFNEVPTGFQNAIEAIVEAFCNFVRESAGEKLMFLGNWYFMVFSFILLSNLSGLLFLRPPTADWTLTFAFAFVTFLLIQAMGIKFRKGGYIKSLFEPYPAFFPLNVIGEISRPISLSFRLFGNILAGTILMGLLYEMAPVLLRFLVPLPLHAFFDVFAGVLQTYVFSVLSLSFISAAASAEGE